MKRSNPFVVIPRKTSGTLQTGLGVVATDDTANATNDSGKDTGVDASQPANAILSVLGPDTLENPGKAAIGGAVAGGSIGLAVGPIGGLIGAAAGGIAGGVAGLILGNKAKKAKKKAKAQIAAANQAEIDRVKAEDIARQEALAAQAKAFQDKKYKVLGDTDKAINRATFILSKRTNEATNQAITQSLLNEAMEIRRLALTCQNTNEGNQQLDTLGDQILQVISNLDGIASDSGLAGFGGMAGLGGGMGRLGEVVNTAVKTFDKTANKILSKKLAIETDTNTTKIPPPNPQLKDWFQKIRATNRVISGLPAAPLPIKPEANSGQRGLAGLADSGTMQDKADAIQTTLVGIFLGGLAYYALKPTRK